MSLPAPSASAASATAAPCPDHAGGEPARAPANPGCCAGAACALHCLPATPLPASAEGRAKDHRAAPTPPPVALAGLPGAVSPPLYRPPRPLA
ncbi:MAG: hypothetical protein OJI70_09025 [Zavarzinia sp.]|nr:hypothetical protein [Zavarzinia sp.]